VRGTSRAIVNADHFNVRHMLFLLRKDEGPVLQSGESISFRRGKDFSLLFSSIFLCAFGAICLFDAVPREGARLAAAVAFGVAALFLCFGGLAAEVIFHRDLRRMDVNWKFFAFDLISHSHPYSEIRIRIFAPRIVSGSGRLSSIQGTSYSADIGNAHYLLCYPEDFPVSDIQLQVVRRELGLLDDGPT
jgi:hypothetical protein